MLTGQCQGLVDYVEPLASAEECLQLCHSTRGCRWFTFQSTVSECILYKNCPSFDETCEACISGEQRCFESESTTTSTTTTTEPPAGRIFYLTSAVKSLLSINLINF